MYAEQISTTPENKCQKWMLDLCKQHLTALKRSNNLEYNERS